MEAKNAIKLLDTTTQHTFRSTVTKKKKDLIFRSYKSQYHLHKWQLWILKHLKQKLPYNNPIIFRADKGKTIVVIDNTTYNELINF